MENPTTDDGPNRRPVAAQESGDAPTLTAEIVDEPDRPAECTIFPLDGSNAELVTRWITASGESFVDLATMR